MMPTHKISFSSLLLLSLFIWGGSGCHRFKKKEEIKPLFPAKTTLSSHYQSAKPETSTDIPYEIVEQMPIFPGGDNVLLNYISENINYPEIAIKNNIHGKVILRFVVSRTGTIGQVEILRSLDAACDKEAIRIIRSFPRWIPGKMNGVNVAVWYVLPVSFNLEK